MTIESESIALHEKLKGKLEIKSKMPVDSMKLLSMFYTPGVAAVSREIFKNKNRVYDLTNKGNSVAIITDGTRVLGLGKVGPEAALPVMEGKAILFKQFGNVDAFPLCIKAKTADEIVAFAEMASPTFGGINIEDIETPKCFEVYERLSEKLDIFVFHDDRQGTAIVTLAGLINALKVVGKKHESAKVVIGGSGAAGLGIAELLLEYGFKNIILVDSAGIIYEGRKENMNKYKEKISMQTNKSKAKGKLEDALAGADVFIGAIGIENSVSEEIIRKMNKNQIVFALTNPNPEIYPDAAKRAGAKVIGTGRSDFPNQINNSLAFPGVFRGALDVRARKINMKMQLAAAQALAGMIKTPTEEKILPATIDSSVMQVIAKAVASAARESGVAQN